AFVTGLGGHGNGGVLQLLGAGLSSRQLGSRLSLQLGATGFHGSQVVLGGRQGFALRDQEVTAVTGTHVNDGTQVTQILDLLKQNDLHDGSPGDQLSWLSENGSRAR